MSEELIEAEVLKSIRKDLCEIEMNYLKNTLQRLKARTLETMEAQEHMRLKIKIAAIERNLHQLSKCF